jgi:hypothetical protein
MTGSTDVTPTVEIDTFTFETVPSWTTHPVTEMSTSTFTVTPVVDVVTYTESITTPHG